MSVGIVITCHNEAPWVLDAVNSALGQTRQADRVVVVDDGSTDGSLDLLLGRDGLEVLTVSQRGMAAARNVGLMALDTDWVVHLDGDDWLGPNFVEATLAEAAVTGADAVVTKLVRDDGLVHEPDFPILAAQVERCTLHSCALFRRSALVAIGGFRSDLGGDCDWGAWVELLARGSVVDYCPWAAYHYRRRPGSLTSTETAEDRARHHALIRELARRPA